MDISLPWSQGGDLWSPAERIANLTGQRIVEGEIEAGDVLTEVRLGEAHGVSRTPAREALLRLESWGLVRLLPKKGALVTAPSARGRRDLLRVRAMLERAAVEHISHHPAAGVLLAKDLAWCIDRQTEALSTPRTFATLDYAFHMRIIRSSDNREIDTILGVLAPRLVWLTFIAVRAISPGLTQLRDEHILLAEAASSGDTLTHSRLLAAHLREHLGLLGP